MKFIIKLCCRAVIAFDKLIYRLDSTVDDCFDELEKLKKEGK